MAAAGDLLKIAAGEIGVKESPAGSNRVKYNTAYYGREVLGSAYPWCAVFVWWCCRQAGVGLPQKTASCTALKSAAVKAGMWVSSGFLPGDIVIYDWSGDGTMDHCGIVESVAGASVTAIEGNTAVGNDSNGGQVMRRVRSLSQISGAVRPQYKKEDMNMDNTPSAEHKENVEWAKENGILLGNQTGDLKLHQATTREEMCTFLRRLYDLMRK